MNKEKYWGVLLGFVCGDVVGIIVEFKVWYFFIFVIDMIGGGLFWLNVGEWMDDIFMVLCFVYSLLYCNGFDFEDQMNCYCNWYWVGYMSCIGECFDIGSIVCSVLYCYLEIKYFFFGCIDVYLAGNGSIMCLVFIFMFYVEDVEVIFYYVGESFRIIYGVEEVIECVCLFVV